MMMMNEWNGYDKVFEDASDDVWMCGWNEDDEVVDIADDDDEWME